MPEIALYQLLDQFVGSLPQSSARVTADSRQVRPGTIFIAFPGGTFDGHDFIPRAV